MSRLAPGQGSRGLTPPVARDPVAAMTQRRDLDLPGLAGLLAITFVLAFNQVVIKVTNDGLQPVFQAGLRSLLGVLCLLIWVAVTSRHIRFRRDELLSGLLLGILFAVEFLLLFVALDMTSVARSAILFYSMPIWLSIAGHFLLPGERITKSRLLGLALAMSGVIWALADRDIAQGNLRGDLMALGAAFAWGGIALTVRLSPLARSNAETQLFWQLGVSAPLLLGAALLGGPLIRDLGALHIAGLGFQAVLVAFAGFLAWFYLMQRYKASTVASFGFLSPVLAVLFGAVLLGERVSPAIWAALTLIGAGIWLINKKHRGVEPVKAPGTSA